MKNIFATVVMGLLLAVTNQGFGQEFSGLDKSPADIAAYPPGGRTSDKAVKVVYSRPQLKGRSLATLAPAGQVWRTGANEASEITFYEDVVFGDQQVAAGTYALFTIPGQGEWTVILNKKLNQWGAFSYNKADDLTRITAKASNASESLEAFSIGYQKTDGGVNMVLGWGTTRVTVPITLENS